MKKFLNKINIKALFIILLLTLFFVGGKALANCGEASWSTPLESFPGAQGNAVGYVSPIDGVSCGVTCGSIGSQCLGSYNVSVNSVGSAGSSFAYICSENNKCSDGNPDGNNSSSTDPYGRSVVVSIVTPKLGITDEHLPVKPDNPVDVDVTVKWWTSKKTSGASDFERCEASSGGAGGKWSGSKNPKGGTESLGKIPLYEGNIFYLDCYYHDDDGHNNNNLKEQKVSGSVSISGSDNSFIIGSNAGSTIMPNSVANNIDVPVFYQYNDPKDVARSIEGDYVGGDMTFYYLENYFLLGGIYSLIEDTSLNIGDYIFKSIGKLSGKLSSSIAINKAIIRMYGGEAIDTYNLRAYLTKEITDKTGVEFGMDMGRTFKGGVGHISVKGWKGIENWHSHPGHRIIPSGPITEDQFVRLVKLLKDRSGKEIKDLSEDEITGYLLKFRKDVLSSDLGDMYNQYRAQVKTYQIGTMSLDGKYVEATYNVLSYKEMARIIKNLKVEDFIKLWGDDVTIRYNKPMMDAIWGGNGTWEEFLLNNKVY